jgi:hypothetical protein
MSSSNKMVMFTDFHSYVGYVSLPKLKAPEIFIYVNSRRPLRGLGDVCNLDQDLVGWGHLSQLLPMISTDIRCAWQYLEVTLSLFNIAMENGPFIDGLPIKNGDFQGLCEFTRGYHIFTTVLRMKRRLQNIPEHRELSLNLHEIVRFHPQP